MTGDIVVPQVIAELFELIEDHQVLAGAAQFPALVEDFLDVAFGAGRGDDFARDLGQPLETLAAHAFRQNRDRLAGQQRRVVRAAAAVVAGAGPHGLLRRRVELPGDQSRHETAEGRADLVRAGGEPLANEARRCARSRPSIRVGNSR